MTRNQLTLLLSSLLTSAVNGQEADAANLRTPKTNTLYRAQLSVSPPVAQVITNSTGFSLDVVRPTDAPANRKTLAAPVLKITENSIFGRGSEYSVRFASDLRTAGSVALRLASEPALRSSVSGLAYVDSDNGKTVLIGEVKSTPAQLVGTDRVLYANAFETDGTFVADVVYRCGPQSFEQDVIIRSALPSPASYGLENSNRVEFCVITEFFGPTTPVQRVQMLDLSDWNATLGTDVGLLPDEILGFGKLRMRMVPGKAFSVGNANETIPVRKEWRVAPDTKRKFLFELTPYDLLKPFQDALPKARAALSPKTEPTVDGVSPKAGTTAGRLGLAASPGEFPYPRPMNESPRPLPIQIAQIEGPSQGLVIDYILVTSPILNVNFGDPAYPKTGPSAVGQSATDFWNLSDTKFNQGSVTFNNLWWSDRTASTVDLTVQNAPGLWGNGVLDDIMYHHYVYSWNAQPVIARLTDIPTDVYDLYVYGHSPGDTGNGLYHLKKNGVEVGYRGTTIWGHLWASTNWTEGEQYVVFRDISVTPGDTLEINVQPVNTYPILAGIQLVPSGAVSEPQPNIQRLINVDAAGTQGAKVGPAAVGQTASDVWNLYQQPWSTYGVLANLSYADGSPSGARLIVQNSPGYWGFDSPPAPIDPMFDGYTYPNNGGNILVSVTDLPSGYYSFYVYARAGSESGGSVVSLACAGLNYGTRGTTIWGNGWASANWQDGQQYVSFGGVRVLGGNSVQLTISPYQQWYTYLNGLQIVKLVDGDNDRLPDDWELQYFGNFDQTGAGDPDGDGLSNLGEYKAGLNPLNGDTDGDGILDGREDSDGDGLTNAGEMTKFGSNPGNAHTFNPVKLDAEYLFTARGGESSSMVDFDVYPPVGGVYSFTIHGADADAVYDLYFVNNLVAPRWQWRRVLNEIKCNSAGEAAFQIRQPDPNSGYFVILSAADKDGDGLTDGYEAWFNYDDLRTILDADDTDLDYMLDGWEVEYGINPTKPLGPNPPPNDPDGGNGNPDGDTYFNGIEIVPLSNKVEHDDYLVLDGSYDPLKIINTSANRPFITISADDSIPTCGASFTISRYGGNDPSYYSNPLTVYYSVGGTLSYDNGDYTITPEPTGLPRIYSIVIPADKQQVTLLVNKNPGVIGTVTISITPFAVSPAVPVQNPASWSYVVDWQRNRATVHLLQCPQTGVLLSGNHAVGRISTINFDTGTEVYFAPDGVGEGRGIAISGSQIYYTRLGTDLIKVAPYGNQGSGGPDIHSGGPDIIRPLPSPRSGVGIQDLDFHDGVLYALTGYDDEDLMVFRLNPLTGTLLQSTPENPNPVAIDPAAPARPSADGFAVLPSGNFLINDNDGLGDPGRPPTSTYREYSKLTGQLVPGGLYIDLNARFGIPIATGVAVAPDGQSLFFAAQTGLVQTDLSGNLLSFRKILAPFGIIEDIAVIVP